jgi:hypothetical protein
VTEQAKPDRKISGILIVLALAALLALAAWAILSNATGQPG